MTNNVIDFTDYIFENVNRDKAHDILDKAHDYCFQQNQKQKATRLNHKLARVA